MPEATIVDCIGKPCPVPVIELARAVASADVTGEVVLLSDDPGAKVDIPVWCRMKSQELVEVVEDGQFWRFRVRRVI
jgi:TusA-related sulfurtransferase